MRKKITFVLIFLFVVATAFAQRAGSLDTTFNHTGIVYTQVAGDTINAGNTMAIQNDGKIVAVGYTESLTFQSAAIVRYNTNGSLDTSFNHVGYVVMHFDSGVTSAFWSEAIQPNGKIVALGWKGNSCLLVSLTVTEALIPLLVITDLRYHLLLAPVFH